MKKRFRRLARLMHKANMRHDSFAFAALRAEMMHTLPR